MNKEDVKILLVGCGRWGKNWYNTILKSPYKLYGVVDPAPSIQIDNSILTFNGREDFIPKEYTHVILSTNPSLHSKYLKQFTHLDKNKILVEKPCGMSRNDAYEFMNIYPGYIFLHDPIVQYIKNNINLIGEPLIYKSIRASMGPTIRTDVSIVEDYLIHDIYIFSWLFGSTLDILSSVKTDYLNNPIKQDTVFVLGKYGKMTINMFSSWVYPLKERVTYIIGSKGAFIWKNEELFFNGTHYLDHWGIDNYPYRDKYGNNNYELIEMQSEKINVDKSKSNLELQLEGFINNTKLNINVQDVWNIIDKINKQADK